MSKISQDLLDEFKTIIEDENKYTQFGNPQHPKILPCKRINGSKYVKVLNILFTIAEIAFMNKYKKFPKSGKELSHICGNDKCKVIDHIEEKTRKGNMKRMSHHSAIRDYEQQIYRHLPYNSKILTPGPILIKNISKEA